MTICLYRYQLCSFAAIFAPDGRGKAILLILTAIIFVAAWTLIKMRAGGSNKDTFYSEVTSSVSLLLCKQAKMTEAEASRFAKSLLDGVPPDAPASLSKVEYSVTKATPTKVVVKISIAIETQEGLKVSSSERDFGWEECPREIRHTFMRDNVTTQAFNLYVRETNQEKT